MTVHSTIQGDSIDGHAQMSAHVDRWRGECIQWFAELQQLIESSLEVLSAVPRRGRKVRLGQPVGCAFGQLRELTADKGAFGKEGRAVACSLIELATIFDWRAHLTHGVRDVWRGKGNNWLLTFSHRDAGGGPVRMHALSWKEAQDLLRRLEKEVVALRSKCGSLRSAVSPN